MVKFYAVRSGREGPKIYHDWSQCEKAVKGWPGARYKSFVTKEAAQTWLINLDNTVVDDGNPWLTIPDPQSSHQPSWLPETPPSVSLDAKPYTEETWMINLDNTVVDDGNPWLTIPDPQPSHQPSWLPETPPSVSHEVESYTEDIIPLPISPDEAEPLPCTVELSDEQQQILNLAKQGRNIFFTGSAGTGKSVLLREIINHFGGSVSERLAITASTGIAAINIGGVTLHSWAGIGLGTENVDKLLYKVEGNLRSRERWRQTETLIIDEISMVDGVLYDKLEYIARKLRKTELPFGGIQLVLSGDFFQLPPVPGRYGGAISFAFEARSWRNCFDTSDMTAHRLTTVFRQRDESFINMLNSLRQGQLDASTIAQFKKLSRPIHYNDGLEPCELFPLREQVRKANETRLRQLSGKFQTFVASDIPGHDMYDRHISMVKAKKLLDRLTTPETIKLKVGAQVMLIKNLAHSELVNGSIGQVVAFQSLAEARGFHTQIAELDKTKESQQWKQKNHVDDALIDTLEQAVYSNRVWPVVRFLNNRVLLLTPMEFEVVNVYGKMEARRNQVPLILSWALSIHKSQGQTLERVKVDLGRIFETGQAYVALSRATCLAGLQVLNFPPSIVMAHPRVLEYYERLDKKQTSQVTPSAHPAPQLYDEFDEFDDEHAMAAYRAVSLEDER